MAGEPPYDAYDGAALGLLETLGLVAALEGADAMLKAAEVRLLKQERTDPALITSTVVGETAAVKAAVEAGRAAAERVGKVVSAHVIPRPAPEVWRTLARPDGAPPAVRGAAAPRAPRAARRPVPDGLAERTVPELRRLARERGDAVFNGRAIARATKDELLRFLRAGRA
jgi:microcompartment protein CcmL/EutN